ncbi:MAG TPA: YtxH domain-containing protein [Terriglobales bacterium]
MKMRKERILFNVMLGAGLYLLDGLRDRLADNLDDVNDRARDKYGDWKDQAKDLYETASRRVSRIRQDVTGNGDDHRVLNAAGAAVIGAGVGFGLALLFAPASGEETRNNIAQKVRDRFSDAGKKSATGTYGG